MVGYDIGAGKKTIFEPRKEIPVLGHYDVLVVGAGTAGTVAALAAARNGARTLVIERGAYVGGTGTAGLMCLYTVPYDLTYGICHEIIDSMAQRGGAVPGKVIPFDPECFKQVALDKLQAAGVKLMFYTWTVDTIVEGNRVKGVIIESKSGRQAVLADVVIDASGDGDVAVWAGAKYTVGRESDNKMRPMSVVFKMGPVDILKIQDYRDRHPEDFSPDPGHNMLDLSQRIVRLDGFFSLARKARDRGEIDRNIHYVRLYGISGPTGNLYVNSVRVYGVDGTKTEDLTRAQEESARQIEELRRFLRAEVPGFENAEILETAVSMGVRETRRIVGDHTLDIDDCGSHRRFPDVIATALTHMVPGVNIHSPDGGEGDSNDPYVAGLELPFNEFSVPLGCILPKGIEDLLVPGRCLSTTHEADGWTRSQPMVMQVGEAAGVVAALAAKEGVSPRALDIRKAQNRLLAQGAHLELPA